jgi:dihydrofolate reductase
MRISIIVAMAQNGVIGSDQGIPWRLSADMKYFKQKTSGHHIIMGRKTWESLGRLLPNRTHIVLSRDPDWSAEGVISCTKLEEALKIASAAGEEEAFVIGGGQIYKMALEFADRMYLTRVETAIEGDTHFDFPNEVWELIAFDRHEADEKNEYNYVFEVYDKLEMPV